MTQILTSHSPKPVIAIDGPAASGKGTLARQVAARLNFAYLDTGALYRAVALEVLQNGQDPASTVHALHASETLRQKLTAPDGGPMVLANPQLREDRVGIAASIVADMPDVRAALKELQQAFAAHPGDAYKGAVLDGRDIGTVICPDADVKLFVTAALEIRAQRRLKELQSGGNAATYEAVLKDMRERDARDTARKAAPMKPAQDAMVLDTSGLSQDDVVEKALAVISEKLF